MLRSMTAFGRAVKQAASGILDVEVSSVNRRHLEIKVQLPQGLKQYERQIVRAVSERIKRGSLFISVRTEGDWAEAIEPDLPYVKKLAEAARQAGEAAGLADAEQLVLTVLASSKELFKRGSPGDDGESFSELLEEVVSEALGALVEMKAFEGKRIQEELRERLLVLLRFVNAVEEAAEGSVEEYRKRLKERLRELFLERAQAERELISREVALFADRADVAEEIQRLRAHLEHFESYLTTEERSIGKTLDFLSQEMLREANTIASKSQTIAISHLVIEIKSEVERIREQVQNVE